MKKIFDKKIIFGIIVGALISGVVVYANVVNSSDIIYYPNDLSFGSHSVSSALDSLYSRRYNLIDRIGELTKSEWYGSLMNKTQTLHLSKGNYYILLTHTRTYYGDKELQYDESFEDVTYLTFSSSGATCVNLNNSCRRQSASLNSSNLRSASIVCDLVKKCSVETSGSVSLVETAATSNKNINALNIYAVKID